MNQPQPQPVVEDVPIEQLTAARLEELRRNYEAARQAGQWTKPLLTEEQRRVAAQLLADLALLYKP